MKKQEWPDRRSVRDPGLAASGVVGNQWTGLQIPMMPAGHSD
jgi:hypothetical protein